MVAALTNGRSNSDWRAARALRLGAGAMRENLVVVTGVPGMNTRTLLSALGLPWRRRMQ